MSTDPRKAAVVGVGYVGAATAFALAQSELFSELALINRNHDRAVAEALDISHGLPFARPMRLYAGDWPDLEGASVVLIAAGASQVEGQTRLDLARGNVEVFRELIPRIVRHAPEAVLLVLSNPVDVLTYVFNKVTDVPESHIIGTGTLLDTARLRSRLADYLNVSQKNVHAYVLGEHGDSSFVPWSIAQISNVPIGQYQQLLSGSNEITMSLDYENIEQYMRTSGGKIIGRKGATFYAIAMSVCHICDCIFSNANEILTLSSLMHGEYGVEDVCLSVPTVLNGSGMGGKLILPLSDEENAKLRHSAEVLRSIIDQVEI